MDLVFLWIWWCVGLGIFVGLGVCVWELFGLGGLFDVVGLCDFVGVGGRVGYFEECLVFCFLSVSLLW